MIYTAIVSKRSFSHPDWNEDNFYIAEIRGFIIGAVFDGCSTGSDSYFASKLFANVFRQTLVKEANKLDMDQFPILVHSFFRNVLKAAHALQLKMNELLSTAVIFIYSTSDGLLLVKFFGDGAVKRKIVQKMISMVESAHAHDVIIGDFNPFNIFVNIQGEVRMLDVDSCETPEMKHSGRLLDEIRDFYYMGKISRESDYFALAVNVFRLLTYVHPYKGVHKTYKSLEERALKRISILSDDPELVIPAFYEPIYDKGQLLQFVRIFNKGERFLLKEIDLNQPAVKKVLVTCTAMNVSSKVLATGVIDFHFNEHIGYVKKIDQTEFYSSNSNGDIKLLNTVKNVDCDAVWMGRKKYLIVKDGQLYNGDSVVRNFEIPKNFRFAQMDNMLFGVDWENSYQIFPDKILNGNLSWNKHPVWGRGFRFEESPVQHAGGTIWIHYQSGETINMVKTPANIRFLKLIGNIGNFSVIENEILKHYWFNIDGLTLKLCSGSDEIFSFALKQNTDVNFVFVPRDGKIDILKVPEFTVVDSMAISTCTCQSCICFTHAGLLLLENQVLYLINRK